MLQNDSRHITYNSSGTFTSVLLQRNIQDKGADNKEISKILAVTGRHREKEERKRKDGFETC